jgi:hypothetical protein
MAGVFTGREDKRLLPWPASSPATHKANEEIKTICVFRIARETFYSAFYL